MDRLKVMTKASQWVKVLIVNTGIPVVVCGMPESEHVLRAEHTERRFKERLTLHCFNWRTAPGRREFGGMLKKLDDSLPLAKASGLADQELAGRFYLACRGVPDYLMTLVRGALSEALRRGSEQIEMSDLARVYETQLAQQRVLLEQKNPFVGPAGYVVTGAGSTRGFPSQRRRGTHAAGGPQTPTPANGRRLSRRPLMELVHPLPAREPLLPGESLASLIRRTSNAMGYEKPGRIRALLKESAEVPAHWNHAPTGPVTQRLGILLRQSQSSMPGATVHSYAARVMLVASIAEPAVLCDSKTILKYFQSAHPPVCTACLTEDGTTLREIGLVSATRPSVFATPLSSVGYMSEMSTQTAPLTAMPLLFAVAGSIFETCPQE